MTFRRLSAVDRYIIAVRRCYRSKRRMLLTVYTAYFGGLDFDILLFFCACGFWDCCFVLCSFFCLFCVWTYGFVSLYVSEFLTAACGVSPLRGRLKDSALKNPAALERLANFFFWVRVCGCCALETQKQNQQIQGLCGLCGLCGLHGFAHLMLSSNFFSLCPHKFFPPVL